MAGKVMKKLEFEKLGGKSVWKTLFLEKFCRMPQFFEADSPSTFVGNINSGVKPNRAMEITW